MKRKKVAIILAYLQNNLGDDLFVQHLCLRYPNVDFYVMDFPHNNETLKSLPNLYFSQEMKKYFKEFDLPQLSKKAKKFYSQFDANVMIGGSIFMQHNQYWQSKLRNFKNRFSANPNTYILGSNFGPFTDPRFLTEFNWAFSKIKDLCFRDAHSASFFPDSKKIRFAPDILFSYKYQIPKQKNQLAISLISCACAGRPAFQVNKLKPNSEKYIDKIVEICAEASKRGLGISLLSFCNKQGDLNIANVVKGKCLRNGITNVKVVAYDGDADIILDELASSKAVVATRFHAMILGFLFGKAVYPIIYDDKQKYVLQDLNFFGKNCEVENISQADAKEILDCLLYPDSLNSYSAIKNEVEKAIIDSEKQFLGLDKILKD